MSGDLTKYNAAKKALAEAHRVDEVKEIRDKAVALRTYAMQAKDRVLIDHATEIRLRAERRAGELLIEMEKNKGAAAGGKKDSPRGRIVQPRDSAPKLSDLNINKSQSSRWQQLATVPDDEFEELVTHATLKACASIDQPKPIPRRKRPAASAKLPESEQRRSDVTAPAMAAHSERGADCYETPDVAVHALLEVENFPGPIWEPACGPGAIVRVLREAGHRVIASDLIDYGCPDSTSGVDFLKVRQAPDGVTAVLTNSPYRHANAFVRHALTLVPRVVMLLPLRFIEGQGRSDILDGGQLKCVYAFRNRLPMMHRRGWQGPKASSALAFAWFVWDQNHKGPTTLHRISWTHGGEAPGPSSTIRRIDAPATWDNLDIPEFPRRTS
jgi:hypothetical protein